MKGMHTVKAGTQTLIYTGTILWCHPHPHPRSGSLLVAFFSEMTISYIQSITHTPLWLPVGLADQGALGDAPLQWPSFSSSQTVLSMAPTDPNLALQKGKGVFWNVFSLLWRSCFHWLVTAGPRAPCGHLQAFWWQLAVFRVWLGTPK